MPAAAVASCPDRGAALGTLQNERVCPRRLVVRSVTAAPTSSREVGAALPCCRISQGETTRPKKEGESLPTSIPSDRPDRWKLLVDRHDQLR